MEETIRFKLNGRETELVTDPNQILLWVLRNHFGLTGTKFGCL
jgi:isoquinoline 1-oxidoreductase alpha subunit